MSTHWRIADDIDPSDKQCPTAEELYDLSVRKKGYLARQRRIIVADSDEDGTEAYDGAALVALLDQIRKTPKSRQRRHQGPVRFEGAALGDFAGRPLKFAVGALVPDKECKYLKLKNLVFDEFKAGFRIETDGANLTIVAADDSLRVTFVYEAQTKLYRYVGKRNSSPSTSRGRMGHRIYTRPLV